MSRPHIPADIQEEINTRLAVKSLIRFRSVCKAWNSLIGCSEFIAAYSLRQTQPHHLLVRYEVGERKETEIKYVSFMDAGPYPQHKLAPTVPPLLKILEDDGSRVIGSSHGLLCFYGHYFEVRKQDMAVIWNPSIKKSIAVVVPDVLDVSFSSVLGFGVCPETNDPKLVKITYIRCWWQMGRIGYIPWQVMVFSVSSKEWKYVCNNLPRKSISFTWSQAVVGKFIYWFAYDSRTAEDGRSYRNHNMIMSFDMCTEEFREVNLPDSLVHLSNISFSISRLKESLALLQYTREDINKKQVCAVWMMEHGDPKSFRKLYTIKPPHLASIQTTLGFRKSGEPIVDMILDYYDQTLVVYEPLSEHIMGLWFCGNGCKSFVNSYTESLLLLNEEDDCIYAIQIDSFEDEDDDLVANCGAVKRRLLEQSS